MADFTTTIDSFATGQITGNPPNSGVLVSDLPLKDFVVDQGGDPNVARILFTINDSDIQSADLDGDGTIEDYVTTGTRIQSFQIDIDGDGVGDFDIRGQNPNDLDLQVGGQEGDNVTRLNGGLRIFEAGTNNQVDQLPSQNLYVSDDGPFPDPGGVKIIDNQGSGTFIVGPPGTVFPPCFTAGTLIETDTGPRLVEEIRVGDLVHTMDHGLQPVRWIGSRHFSHRELAAEPRFCPILFDKGACNNERPLMVSPQHRMLVESMRAALLFEDVEVLVPALAMANGASVRSVNPAEGVTYFHLLFDAHEIVFAEGAPSESFHPGDVILRHGDRQTRAELLALFPELADQGATSPTARPVLNRREATALLRLMAA
ncbi:Hint domain-containing protein [Rhodobacteraceae bacterium NNCM2]|nr:Hint domain-containing protein [Coraliihabitans acroporae]